MAPLQADPRRFLDHLPDEPSTALARGLLMAGHADILADEGSSRSDPAFALILPTDALAIVPGPCSTALFHELLERRTRFEEVVFCRPESGLALNLPPGIERIPYTLYRHPTPRRLLAPERPVELIGADTFDPALFQAWDDESIEEIIQAVRRGPLYVVLEEGQALAVAHAFSETERFFDVALETRSDRRRGGLASSAFLALTQAQLDAGREPLWGAAETNAPSGSLARRLGFEAVAEGMLIQAE